MEVLVNTLYPLRRDGETISQTESGGGHRHIVTTLTTSPNAIVFQSTYNNYLGGTMWLVVVKFGPPEIERM